jgi:hypothetical protein
MELWCFKVEKGINFQRIGYQRKIGHCVSVWEGRWSVETSKKLLRKTKCWLLSCIINEVKMSMTLSVLAKKNFLSLIHSVSVGKSEVELSVLAEKNFLSLIHSVSVGKSEVEFAK